MPPGAIKVGGRPAARPIYRVIATPAARARRALAHARQGADEAACAEL
jgi:hypothetical protein